ncbi:MAG TPA: response regulator transcription factor [Candidatus Bathyarchaeia archaeon]|nr:response regulator transcription factor [Candidatus Bathyarchaeia archaeon]
MTTARILVVDDCKPWRLALRSLVHAISGARIVGEADDGLDAIEKARQLLPDLVLLDIGLPRLNGIAAARKIRDVSPDSRIIFLTQEEDSDVRIAALATGAAGYVLKTNVVSELCPTIQDAVTMRVPNRATSFETVEWVFCNSVEHVDDRVSNSENGRERVVR